MRGNRRGDTRPEMLVRRAIHRLGARFRLHAPELPGRPDLMLRRRRLVIFVHGCFWHDHDRTVCTLRRATSPSGLYWSAKLARNVERDAEGQAQLAALGWRVAVIWECETRDPVQLSLRLSMILG